MYPTHKHRILSQGHNGNTGKICVCLYAQVKEVKLKVTGNLFSCLEILIHNGENRLREMEKASSMKEK